MKNAWLRFVVWCAAICWICVQDAFAQSPQRSPRLEPTVRMAGIVLKWVTGDQEANSRRLEPMIREAVTNGARLICTSECCLDGNAAEEQDAGAPGEEIPGGKYYQRLAALAGELKIHLVAGLYEADGTERYRSVVLIGPDGELIGKQRNESSAAESTIFETEYGKLGLAVGADRTDPRIIRRFFDRNVGVVLSPAGAYGPLEAIIAQQARSRENLIHIVAVHPTAFLATGPEGTNRKREILGDQVRISRDDIDTDKDAENGIVYYDLPIRLGDVAVDIEQAIFQPMQGQALYHRSNIYGDLQPIAVCATDVSDTPKPLLVNFLGMAFPKFAARECESLCQRAKKQGLDCVVLCVGGRIGGAVHQGYGEVDVYEALAAVQKKLAIDPDRISVTGGSVGGAATWYHASHYPDVWAAAAPRFGYCDDRVWEKASLTSFIRRDWEEFSWITRSAAYRPANLRHVALRIIHGEWDRAVPGGVPVEHSRQMHRKLTEADVPHTYIEVPKTGHADPADQWDGLIAWMLTQKKERNPDRVSLVAHGLRHNRSQWVEVLQQTESGRESTIEAKRDRKQNSIRIATANVCRLELGPLADQKKTKIELDQEKFDQIDLTKTQRFERSANGTWSKMAGEIPVGEKRHGLSGPFGDLFIEPLVIVYGLSGTDEASEYNKSVSLGMARLFNQSNGGVHRGSIPGDNNIFLPILSDQQYQELTAESAPDGSFDVDSRLTSGDYAKVSLTKGILQRANLLLVGNADANVVLAKLSGKLPVTCHSDKLELGGKTFAGEHLGFFAIFPHPDGRRYVALLGGTEPDVITWGGRVGLQLLPDYLVFQRDHAIEWGFWDNHWKHREGAAK